MIQQIIVTSLYPNQSINFIANNQNITLNLYWLGFINQESAAQTLTDTYAIPQFYGDIYLGNTAIITGIPVIDRTPINLYTSDFVGYIVSVDTEGDSNPSLTNLGVTVFLYYIDTLAELANLAIGTAPIPIIRNPELLELNETVGGEIAYLELNDTEFLYLNEVTTK